jgi:Phage tail assembly chaperone protein
MGIFFDAHPQNGSVRFYHEAIDGPRQIPAPQTNAEVKAGKRPVMIDNPSTRIPAAATEISTARFEALMAAQQEGAQIILSRGKPVAVPRVLSAEEHSAARRRRRDQLLAASDWTQLPDSPVTEGEKDDWREYRTALRDLDMDGTSWPIAPDGEEDE